MIKKFPFSGENIFRGHVTIRKKLLQHCDIQWWGGDILYFTTTLIDIVSD